MALVDGIWEYDEGDVASPTFSELLNLLGDSVRDRITALEADLTDDTGWVDVPLREGFTNNVKLQVRRLGEQVYCKGRVAGSFTTGNVIIGDIPAGFRPVGTVHRPALTFNTNAVVTGSAAIGTDGTLNVSASTAGSHIVNVFTQWLAS